MFNPPMYRIFLSVPKYCRITDALLGERRIFQFAVYTEEMARHIVKKFNEETHYENYYNIYFGNQKLVDKTFVPPVQVIVEDDIPF